MNAQVKAEGPDCKDQVRILPPEAATRKASNPQFQPAFDAQRGARSDQVPVSNVPFENGAKAEPRQSQVPMTIGILLPYATTQNEQIDSPARQDAPPSVHGSRKLLHLASLLVIALIFAGAIVEGVCRSGSCGGSANSSSPRLHRPQAWYPRAIATAFYVAYQ